MGIFAPRLYLTGNCVLDTKWKLAAKHICRNFRQTWGGEWTSGVEGHCRGGRESRFPRERGREIEFFPNFSLGNG